jgi:hypothetical protein
MIRYFVVEQVLRLAEYLPWVRKFGEFLGIF